MEQVWPLLIGPYGGFAFAVIAALLLWRAHQKADDKRDAALEAQMAINAETARSMPVIAATIEDIADVVLDRRTQTPAPTRPGRRDRRAPG